MEEKNNEALESTEQPKPKPEKTRKERRMELKISKKLAKIQKQKITLKRVRIGNFEVRVSESKVEIEDVVRKLSKHVYSIESFEGSVIAHMLSPMVKDEAEEGYRTKTDKEIEDGVKNVDLLLVALVYTNLIFSNPDFRAGYFKLVDKTINPKKAKKVDKKEDDEIIDELKTVEEMKEVEK